MKAWRYDALSDIDCETGGKIYRQFAKTGKRARFAGDIKRLKGQQNKELYRLRVGSYRIIYTVDRGELVVLVIGAGNRGQIYDKY